MPPYSESAATIVDEVGSLVHLDETFVKENDTILQVTPAIPDEIITTDLPASRDCIDQPEQSLYAASADVDERQVGRGRATRPRRRKVQSMPVGSQGAIDFFGESPPLSAVSEVSEESNANKLSSPTSRHRRVRSKSINALGEIFEERIIEVEESDEVPPFEMKNTTEPPQLKEQMIDKTVQEPTPVSSAKSSERVEARCQCIIL